MSESRPTPPLTEDERPVFEAEMVRLSTEEKSSSRLDQWRSHIVSAAELQTMEFPPRVAYIEGLVLEGLSIFGGKPKLGKSWWAMRAGLTIATGGVAFGNPNRKVTEAPVLCLALEDGPARLQDRISRLLSNGERWPSTIRFADSWPRFSEGGLELMADMIDTDGYRVVIVDTFARVRKAKRTGADPYQEDSDAMAMIHDLVRSRPGLAMWVVHHNRKHDQPADYIDALSGTTGIGGVPDHIAVLTRPRNKVDGVLQFTSRDAAEHETAYAFRDGAWTELGNAAVYQLTKERQEVLAALEDLGGRAPLSEVVEVLGKDKANTRKMLIALAGEGLVRQDGDRGPWVIEEAASPASTPVSEEPPDPADPPPEPDELPDPFEGPE